MITVSVPRSFKNGNGIYDADIVDLLVTGGMASQTLDCADVNDIIGIKGRIARLEDEQLHLVAERITFLSSKGGQA